MRCATPVISVPPTPYLIPTPPRIHDLLDIDTERFLEANSSVPAWVAKSLRHAPFVVVRRGPISAVQGIAVGVRGPQRNERWPALCHPDLFRSVLTPPMLLTRLVTASPSAPASRPTPPIRVGAIPALRTLTLLADRWKALDFPWGPGGSVGFELATGRPVATPQSDLDIVIYAETRMTHDEARVLHESARGLPAAVDIRVETPTCGFSLTEYANAAPLAPILLRFAAGTALGPDPWAAPS
jgi:phosphoribosyl-dephospho-CoA transferase